ncbi:hypothetical protein [Tumebacillus flagellatus]|uniref:YubB ferredoxin-like domain-containing protein n=1 Tax=Tumebacillus flagellatus TaxID=1157490 RepID=A0A074M4D1_9BACL|nr:hypothetical protein [Tumebacillus flagellatus]KEO80867.1 hypothetical protein EL26_23910 [Tumebacillus flagellatus]
MPNHVTNRLTIIGTEEQVAEVKKFLAYGGEIGTIDFNAITPMPKWVFNGNTLSGVEEEKYGEENCWYRWSINNWGTKWNAYSQPDHRNTADTIYFTTAWSAPLDLMKKLSWIYPNLEFEFAWADEDLGRNIGKVKFQDGVAIEEYEPEGGSREARELFFQIMQATPAEYGMNENYEYVDDEEGGESA